MFSLQWGKGPSVENLALRSIWSFMVDGNTLSPSCTVNLAQSQRGGLTDTACYGAELQCMSCLSTLKLFILSKHEHCWGNCKKRTCLSTPNGQMYSFTACPYLSQDGSYVLGFLNGAISVYLTYFSSFPACLKATNHPYFTFLPAVFQTYPCFMFFWKEFLPYLLGRLWFLFNFQANFHLTIAV